MTRHANVSISDGCAFTPNQENVGMFPESQKLAQRKFRSFKSCQEWCDANPRCKGVAVSPAYWAYRECFLVGTSDMTFRWGWTASSRTECNPDPGKTQNTFFLLKLYVFISCIYNTCSFYTFILIYLIFAFTFPL